MTQEGAEAIRAARAALRDAVLRRDRETIAALLLPSYRVVTAGRGTDARSAT